VIIDLLVNKMRFLRARSRHKTLRLKVARMPEFLSALNREIPYVILRWHDRVPLTESSCRQAEDDVDFLIDDSFQDRLVSIASRFRGPVKCDFYGVGAQRGFAYNRLPYYPPALASLVLRDRVFSAHHGFYVPDAKHHLLTFVYHLVYHKGTKSGIPMCAAAVAPSVASGPNAYLDEAQRIARAYDVALTLPRTLTGLYEYLVNAHWQMPLDLLIRWKVKDEWHQHLIQREWAGLSEWSQRLPDLVVFVIRGDAAEETVLDAILDAIRKEYLCLAAFALTEHQIDSLTRHARGGNWVEGKKNTPILPHSVAFCVPRPGTGRGTCRRDERVASLKQQIRQTINRQFRQAAKLRVVHSTDDALEAQYYLHLLYGDDRDSQCRRIESSLERPPVSISGLALAEQKITRQSGAAEDAKKSPPCPWSVAPHRNVA